MYKIGFWILLVVVVAGLVGGAYYYGQQTGQKQPQVMVEEVEDIVENPTSSPSAQINDKKMVVQNSAMPKPTPVVTYEAAGSIPEADKQQLQQRVVNPFVDYYLEHADENELVSLTISPNTQASKVQSPYLGQAVFKNGGNSGFVIDKTNGQIQWWSVDCMICTFSDSYKQKYPEVVKNYL